MEEKSHSVEPYAIGAEERQHHDDRRGRGGGGGGGSLGDDDSDDIDDNKDDVHESQHRMSSSYKQSHCSVASRSVASPKKKGGDNSTKHRQSAPYSSLHGRSRVRGNREQVRMQAWHNHPRRKQKKIWEIKPSSYKTMSERRENSSDDLVQHHVDGPKREKVTPKEPRGTETQVPRK